MSSPATKLEEQMLLSVPEVAALVGASKAHVWRLNSSGRFGPALLHLGRLRKVRRVEVIAWINAGCPPRARWEWEPMKGGCRCAQ